MNFDDTKSTFGTYEDRAIWLVDKLLADFPEWQLDDACADAGNLGAESEIQMIQEGGQTPPNGGFGLPQWTGPRRQQFESYCSRTGRNPSSMTSGYDFHFVELKGTYAKVVGEVAAATSLPAKVAAFEQHYEMAGVVRMDARNQFAQRAKAAYLAKYPVLAPSLKSKPVPQPLPVPVSPPSQPAPTTGVTMISGASLLKILFAILSSAGAVILPLLPPPWNLIGSALLGSGVLGHAMTSAVATDTPAVPVDPSAKKV